MKVAKIRLHGFVINFGWFPNAGTKMDGVADLGGTNITPCTMVKNALVGKASGKIARQESVKIRI